MKNVTSNYVNSGFTLIESLVAITVLLTAIVAPMTIAYQGIAATNLARDQMIAQYLAQDAAEYIIAKKISNDIKVTQGVEDDWADGFTNCISVNGNTNGCYFDTYSAVPASLGTACDAVCPQMVYDTTDHRYETLSSGQSGKFTRKVLMESLNNGNELRVTVTVSWQSSLSTIPRSVPLRFNLYNQR